jgi:hypothetical protein
MTRSIRTTLFLALLMASASSPALARMVVGVTPAVLPGAADQAALTALEQELTARMGEPVQVRSFASEAAQIDWLIRFRELDAALISHSQAGALPSGTMIALADTPPAVAVTHPGVAAGQLDILRRGFRSLAEDDRGRQLLKRLAGTVKPAVVAKPAPARPVAPPAPAQPIVMAPAKPAAITPAVRPAAAPTTTPAPVAPKAAEPMPPPAPPVGPSVIPVTPPPPTKTPTARPPATQTPALKPPPAASPATAAPQTAEPSSPKRTRLLLIAALVVLAGLGAKVMLLMRHWKQRRQVPDAPLQPPSAETFDYQGADTRSAAAPMTAAPAQAPAAPAAAPVKPDTAQPVVLRVNVGTKGKVNFDFRTPTPVATQPSAAPLPPPAPALPAATAKPAIKKPSALRRKAAAVKDGDDLFPPVTEELVVEQGRLGRTKVPALLKHCAGLPQPVVLRARTYENETCVHFAAGQICHAYSRDWRVAGDNRQWSKLGNLMVREELIAETQRDQALALIERQDGLRLPAALQQLGIFDIEALRHILARQAKTTLFALILFSAGEYRVEADNDTIPAEESISLQVEELIREASHHQAEWTAIRKVLPTLGTLLDFAPDGREKLDQVRLSVQQQLLLSQVDGQATLGALCNASTMMDYEVSRFLYLMVKAGVLQVAPAS